MVGKAYDCVANPLGAVRFLFDKAAGQGAVDQRGSDWGVNPLFSKTLLDDGALSQVITRLCLSSVLEFCHAISANAI